MLVKCSSSAKLRGLWGVSSGRRQKASAVVAPTRSRSILSSRTRCPTVCSSAASVGSPSTTPMSRQWAAGVAHVRRGCVVDVARSVATTDSMLAFRWAGGCRGRSGRGLTRRARCERRGGGWAGEPAGAQSVDALPPRHPRHDASDVRGVPGAAAHRGRGVCVHTPLAHT